MSGEPSPQNVAPEARPTTTASAAHDAFSATALVHLDELVQVARRTTGDPALAEDLVQETFLEAWRSFHNFEPGTNCRAWLYKILFRRISRARRRSRTQELALGDDEAPLNHLAVPPRNGDPIVQRRLREALKALSEPHRDVVMLADVQELRYREVADVLGIPVGTVMSRLNRARRQLRGSLMDRRVAALTVVVVGVVLASVSGWLRTRDASGPGPSVAQSVRIDAPVAEVWQALTNPQLSREYFFNLAVESDWREGSAIGYRNRDGRPMMRGTILEIAAPNRLRHSVHVLRNDETTADPASTVTWELVATDSGCEVTMVHDGFGGETATYRTVSGGWPVIVAGLKELVETGQVTQDWRRDQAP